MSKPTQKRQTISNTAKTGLSRMTEQALDNIKAALESGDVPTSILVLSWTVPKPKPIDDSRLEINQDLVGMSVADQVNCINDAVLSGNIPVSLADAVFTSMLKARQVLESTEFEERLQRLEQQQNEPLSNPTIK